MVVRTDVSPQSPGVPDHDTAYNPGPQCRGGCHDLDKDLNKRHRPNRCHRANIFHHDATAFTAIPITPASARHGVCSNIEPAPFGSDEE